MTLSERIAALEARLPAEFKMLLDAERTEGNTIIAVEAGREEREGQTVLILERPFHRPKESPAPGIQYRETIARDRRIFEFFTDDGRFSLAHVQFKPMILTPLPEGPLPPAPRSNPPVERGNVMVVQEKTVSSQEPAIPIKPEPRSAVERFIESMTMTFDRWHDGGGYDLEALQAIPSGELPAVEALLIAHQPRDWCDIEALAQIDSPRARQVVAAARDDDDPKVRREAARYSRSPLDTGKREALLITALKSAVFFGGLSAALEEVETFHPPKVKEALLRGTQEREGEVAVHFAAMLYFLYGKAKEPFDWEHRPFFLRFHTTDKQERRIVFRELCATIGVDPDQYTGSHDSMPGV